MIQRALIVSLSMFGGACAADPLTADAIDGEALYSAPHADGNTFACATCHALNEPAADGFTRAGHPIGDASARPSYKNGQLATLREAVDSCRSEWMAAPALDDARWGALEAFLMDQSDADAEALRYEIVDPPGDVSGGDALAGETRFNETCAACHGDGGRGSERAPAIAGSNLSAAFIARKIRRSGNPDSAVYPDLVPGRMPFWAADRLSDDELRNIVAFVEASMPVDVPVEASGVDVSLPGAQSDCGRSHPAVGRTLTFATHAHGVSGRATIVDDCTIAFEDFSFDGGGIDVRVYGGKNGNYADGFSMSMNLVGSAFDQASATLRVPPGIDFDDFDGVSIWCVPVGFSFGDGEFE